MLTEEAEQNPSVSPPVMVLDVQRLEEFIADLYPHEYCPDIDTRRWTHRVLAVTALSAGVIRVIQVATSHVDKVLCPLTACLSRGRGERGKLVRLASDNKTAGYTTSILCHSDIHDQTYCNSVETMALKVRVYGSSW